MNKKAEILETKVILETCYHCGNKGNLTVVGKNVIDTCDGEPEQGDPWLQYFHFMLLCPVCNNISLYEKYTAEYMQIAEDEYDYTKSILYPRASCSFHGVPENIKTAFEAAIKVSKIDVAISALALRRVIELICKEKKAVGKTLIQMVNYLIKNNILPQTFDKAMTLIRTTGNEGAHGDDINIDIHDINQLTNFVESIISYLYILPSDINSLEERINRRKMNKITR